jgi:hypothetical protein
MNILKKVLLGVVCTATLGCGLVVWIHISTAALMATPPDGDWDCSVIHDSPETGKVFECNAQD